MADRPATPAPASGDDDVDLAARRDAVRRAARAARAAVDPAARDRAADLLRPRLVQVVEAAAAVALEGTLTVALTVAVDGEVDVAALAGPLRDAGHTVALPVVGPDGTMHFARWLADDPLVPNRFGVPEPVGAPEERPDVVVVPCVAVDRDGNRLGFGKGYYDRALAALDALAVGAVLAEQVVEEIPVAVWDVPLDVVVTPDGVLRPDRSPRPRP